MNAQMENPLGWTELPSFEMHVRRNNLVHDTMMILDGATSEQLARPLKVRPRWSISFQCCYRVPLDYVIVLCTGIICGWGCCRWWWREEGILYVDIRSIAKSRVRWFICVLVFIVYYVHLCSYLMFRKEDESNLMWFTGSEHVDQHQFLVLGKLAGLAVYNRVNIDFRFPLAFYKVSKNYFSIHRKSYLMTLFSFYCQKILIIPGSQI